MKKMILTMVAVVAMSVNAMASNSTNTNRDTNKGNLQAIENYLQLDAYQSNMTREAGITLQDALKEAMNQQDETQRKHEVKKAVTNHLRRMHTTLDDAQYKKYLKTLNVTLNNYGLQDYVR